MQPMNATEAMPVPDDALRYILEAWDSALQDGVSPQLLAYSALYVALSDLVAAYGENAVAELADGLVRRIEEGEFTLYRSRQ